MNAFAGAVLGLALSAAAPVLASEAIPVPFPAVDPAEPSAVAWHCTEEPGWCARLEAVEDRTVGLRLQAEGADQPLAVTLVLDEAPYPEDVSFWNQLVPLGNGDLLLGVEVVQGAFYSGGGGEATWLSLYRIGSADGDRPLEPVLSVAMAADIAIRACFAEDDSQKRLGACQDEYAFVAELAFTPGSGPVPAIDYATEARSFPAPVRRWQDSSTLPPLTEADLIWAIDEACSIQRRFVFDDASGVYVPDSPLPDCSDYTLP